jgi:hypothetical protein
MMAGPAAAQSLPGPAAQTGPSFLSRSAFAVAFAPLVSDDPRFTWSARVGVDADIAAYRHGRLNFWGEYEGILGSERRLLDLNHENFHLEMSSSYVLRGTEVAPVFDHVSRHLTDRANDQTVAWNTFGLRAIRALDTGAMAWRGGLELTRVLQHTYVDYAWNSRLVVEGQRPLSPRLRALVAASGELMGIDETRSDRDRQCGARVKAGVLVDGERGAVELYAAYERRIDGYPLARTRTRFFEFGFILHGR